MAASSGRKHQARRFEDELAIPFPLSLSSDEVIQVSELLDPSFGLCFFWHHLICEFLLCCCYVVTVLLCLSFCVRITLRPL